MGHAGVLLSELGYFLLTLKEILGVHVSIASDSFVEILLMFQLGLDFGVFLLQLSDLVIFNLHLFNCLVKLGMRLGRLDTILLLLPLQLVDLLSNPVVARFVAQSLILGLLEAVDQVNNLVVRVVLDVFLLFKAFLLDGALFQLLLDVLFKLVSLLLLHLQELLLSFNNCGSLVLFDRQVLPLLFCLELHLGRLVSLFISFLHILSHFF